MWPVSTLPMRRGRKGRSEAHEAEGLETHEPEVALAALSLEHVGQEQDFVADFAVGGQVAGAVIADDHAGGLAFGREVLGLFAGVHELRCAERNLPTDTRI
jgi:hypothetical protein